MLPIKEIMPIMLIMLLLSTMAASTIKFSMSWNHSLMILLTLEFMSLSLFTFIFLLPTMTHDSFSPMLILSFLVIESAMGLTILILYSRMYGNDLIKLKSLAW